MPKAPETSSSAAAAAPNGTSEVVEDDDVVEFVPEENMRTQVPTKPGKREREEVDDDDEIEVIDPSSVVVKKGRRS